MTPTEGFEVWWKEAYDGSTLHDKETARTFWLAAWRARGERDVEIAQHVYADPAWDSRYRSAGEVIAVAIAQAD